MNNLRLKEVEEGDQYRYLGIDESVGSLCPLNKKRMIKEYKSRIKKIWNSELNALNKMRAHNAYVVLVIGPQLQ